MPQLEARRVTKAMVSTFAFAVAIVAWGFTPERACGTTCAPASEWSCVSGGSSLDERCDVGIALCRAVVCNEDPDHIICNVE
jgi:hypothetical protein